MAEQLLRSDVTAGMRFAKPGRLSILSKARPPAPFPCPAPLTPRGARCSVAAQERLIVEHQDLVHRIARTLLRRVPPCVELDDLISAGNLGLIAAARRFDGRPDVTFATYAGHRIRGAIIDDIRSRGLYSRVEIKRAEAGDPLPERPQSDSEAIERAADSRPAEIADVLLTPRLRAALALLPRRESLLLVWRFWHELTLDTCAQRMGVNESRASQLQAKALERLRDILDAAHVGRRDQRPRRNPMELA